MAERIRQSIIPKLDQQLRFAEKSIEQANRIAKEAREKAPVQALRPSPTTKQAEQRAQEIRKGKQPEQGWYQHSTHAGTKGKEVEQPIQTVTEGKKPEQPQSHDSQASLRRKKTRQHTIEPSIRKDPETIEPQPKRQQEYEIQIARIPIGKDAPMETVKVYISPDTAYRNSQTLIFKHFPNVQFYWGERKSRNAWATRIVRLEKEGNPTPYFLLVNNGGQLKCRPPRNQNANLTDVREPIFGDAFVFKLGDPELHEDPGHARYVDIEMDVGRISWLPGSIREAATKVKSAGPANANPGFPDLRNYAASETVKQQVPEAVKRRDYEMVKNVIERMTSVIYHRRKDVDFLGTDLDPEADNTISTACAAFRSIRECADVKSTDAVEEKDRPFQEMEEAFCDFLRKLKAANRTRDESGDQASEVQEGVEDALGLLIDEIELQEELIQWEAADLD